MKNHSSTIKTAKNYEITYLLVTKKNLQKSSTQTHICNCSFFLKKSKALCAKQKEKGIKAFKTSRIQKP